MEQIKELGKTEALTLANFILKHYGPMSHLKLQKLLYYCEAYHLAYFNRSIIDEEFQAWIHGPVCRRVYDEMKAESILYSDIAFDNNSNPDYEIETNLTSDQKQLLKDVLEILSTWTGFELETSTHKEAPWINARRGFGPADRCDTNISKEEMKEFYKNELNG